MLRRQTSNLLAVYAKLVKTAQEHSSCLAWHATRHIQPIVHVTWSTAYNFKVLMCNPLCSLSKQCTSCTLRAQHIYTSGMPYVRCMWADTKFCCGWLQGVEAAAALVVSVSTVGHPYLQRL